MSNRNTFTWSIWGVLTFTLLTLLISSIVFFYLFYKKRNRKILTIKKITIMAVFMSFFLIQTFIFRPLMNLPIPFSFDSITVITVGFIFGPIEGIIFGWTADTLRVLIHGWSYQFLPSLIYPIIGLIAGAIGILYNKKSTEEIKMINWKFQGIVAIIFSWFLLVEILLLTLPKLFVENGDILNKNYYWLILVNILLIVFLESIYFYEIKKSSNKSENLYLLVFVLIIVLTDRSLELIVRPFTQYWWNYESNYTIALFTRIASSTYLIPTIAITSFVLIKSTNYVLDYN